MGVATHGSGNTHASMKGRVMHTASECKTLFVNSMAKTAFKYIDWFKQANTSVNLPI